MTRLIELFPHAGISEQLVDEYNRQSKLEFELIRDFIILTRRQRLLAQCP